jgi:hypothetical protein
MDRSFFRRGPWPLPASSASSRQFIERVLTNYWLYQDCMGQKVPTLDALASGGWPIYAGGHLDHPEPGHRRHLSLRLPGSPGACRDGWDDILKWQLDSRFRPCNLVELMPRLHEHLQASA